MTGSAPREDAVVGRHAVAEVLGRQPARARELLLARGGQAGGKALASIISLARAAGVKQRQVERAQLDQLAGGASHQGVALLLAPQAYAPLEDLLAAARAAGPGALLVACDHIQDPHNLGAIIRSAAGAGAQGIIIPKDRACPLTPAVAKAAAGAAALLPICRVTNLATALGQLKKDGLWLLAAATRQAPPPWELDLRLPLVLIVGGEHKGVGPGLLGLCDLTCSLPLAGGLESLNASVAAGVLLFEIMRQRQT